MARAKHGLTPLHWAAVQGNPASIQILLDADADVNALYQDGSTPLHLATASPFKGSGAILALLNAGAGAKSKDENGKTPWDIAQDIQTAERYQSLLGAERRAVQMKRKLCHMRLNKRQGPVPRSAMFDPGCQDLFD